MIIEGRFNGPAGSGNGGYTAGLVASRLPASRQAADQLPAEVTLRAPPPLDTPLRVARSGAGGVAVYAGELLVAEAVPVPPGNGPAPPVPPVPYQQALAASAAYPGLTDHPFPTCYVCGTRRPAGDGLRIFPGPTGDGRTAAGWQVPEDVSALTVWAALDCPGGWAIISPGRPYVLGRMAAQVRAVPAAGDQCVVMGELVTSTGRKAQVRTALYGPGGDLLADARSTWIAVATDPATAD